ncbi:hypothetical protein E2C01_051348 [Portunus trituberculatus]|uniref:Uncharacterized protein n=1 Tax=Portunus trituberculatus TaxID=210409 RepID=A0A5B7GIN4_PORTR|nr:hypothetical protein [Portunus trituberculatus]
MYIDIQFGYQPAGGVSRVGVCRPLCFGGRLFVATPSKTRSAELTGSPEHPQHHVDGRVADEKGSSFQT